LRFRLVEYDIEGNMLGVSNEFSELRDQLFVCETSREDREKLLTIGTTLIKECSFDLATLVHQHGGAKPR